MARVAVLTEIEKQNRQKKRCRTWHHKMTTERRCHWCGKPSSNEYANACEEHLELSRATTKYLKEQKREMRRAKGLCVECGKRPARFGYSTCYLCGAIGAARHRRYRERRKDRFFDYIFQKNLINIDDAASIIGVTRMWVHQLIGKGILQVKYEGWRSFWLAESDILSYKKERDNRLLVRCRRCGHKWHPLKMVNKLRCPIIGCRGLLVDKIGGNK